MTESWGQPPISIYAMRTEGDHLYGTELDDCYGELMCSNHPAGDMMYLTPEDLEDVALCDLSSGEPTMDWKDLKQELAGDGLL